MSFISIINDWFWGIVQIFYSAAVVTLTSPFKMIIAVRNIIQRMLNDHLVGEI